MVCGDQESLQPLGEEGGGLWYLGSEETAVFEVLFDDNVGNGIEYELDVLSISSTGHVRVDFFHVPAHVQLQELHLDVVACILICIGSCRGTLAEQH